VVHRPVDLPYARTGAGFKENRGGSGLAVLQAGVVESVFSFGFILPA